MIRGVILDMDGVVLDSMIIWKDLGARFVRSFGYEPEPNLGEILFSMSMEEGANYIKNKYHLEDDVKSLVEKIGKQIEAFYFEEAELKPGARELMEFLKHNNIPMIAATSSMKEHISRALTRNGLKGYMKGILTSAEVGESKHSPIIYNMAAESINTTPAETLVLEDSLYALETAKNAGFIPIAVYDALGESNQEKLKETGRLYVKDLKEVIPFIISENNMD